MAFVPETSATPCLPLYSSHLRSNEGLILYTIRSAALTALTDLITAEKITADTHSIANITPVTGPTTALIPMSTPISAPAVIHLHTGYSTADRLRAPTNTPGKEKSAYSSCCGVVHKRKTSCGFNSSFFSNRRLVPYLPSFN